MYVNGFARITRRRLLSDAAALTAAGLIAESGVLHTLDDLAHAAAPTPAPSGYGDADYWAFIDPIAEAMDRRWDPGARMYTAPMGETQTNAAMLTVHAVAALKDHHGPARDDARARTLTVRLCQAPPWRDRKHVVATDKMFHHRGWGLSMTNPSARMEKSNDPKIAEALAMAWSARKELELSGDAADRLVKLVDLCARDEFWAYPNTRLNQINWNAEMFAHDATVTGTNALLVGEYRRHLRHFVNGIRKPWRPQHGHHPFTYHSRNLGPGYRFNRENTAYPSARQNLDSAEYANVTAHALLWYRRARLAGMTPLPAADMRLLRAWVERLLYGYWTHSGFMSWDTGMGLERWMVGKYFAWGQHGLLALAFATDFHTRPEMAAWAKYMFDRSLDLYREWARAGGNAPFAPRWFHGVVPTQDVGADSTTVFGSRMAANTARAIVMGLADRPAQVPPPFYSFDPDIGRLSVSTPTYAAAVLVANKRAIDYGGQELARLYDGQGHPVGTIGGRPPAAFGVVVRDDAGRTVLASQVCHKHASMTRPPLRLIDAPRGTGRLVAYPRHAYAGPFERLKATSTVRDHGIAIRTTHTFRAADLETAWTVTGAGRARQSIDVLFPSWTAAAVVELVLHDGRHVTLVPGQPAIDLAKVAWAHLHGQDGGYVVVFTARSPKAAGLRALATHPQRYAPRPGPTLAVRVAAHEHVHLRRLTARIATAHDAADAARVAARLGA